ncbi:MAG: S-layer homology domain-containing protein [Sedimentibacter sp.]|uniref:S-layer homology domain-containing protein n=1 Tax=Sedimentibacter sp. TaxID=1960295 RepID=UPI0031587AF2
MFKTSKKLTSLVLCISMIISVAASPAAFAQTQDSWDEPVVQIDNGIIRVTAAKQTGRFIAETVGGIPNKGTDDNQDLLYANRFKGPETSYASVRIDGEDFIFGNSYGFMGIEGHYTTSPYIDAETNSIISQWSAKDVVITQKISLVSNPKLPSVGNVYVEYEMVNKSSTDKSVGLRLLLDTKLGSVDSPALTIPAGGFIYKEAEFTADEIPSVWYAFDQYLSPKIIATGTVSGEGLTKPDKLQFAAWGDVSQTKWDYTIDPDKSIIQVLVDGLLYEGPNGTYPDNSTVIYSVKDSCAVLYYNPQKLESGGKKSVKTSYGVGDASQKDGTPSYSISLQGTDKLNMKQDKSGYTVDYVSAEFNIDNNFDNSSNLLNAQIELELPDELELVEGSQKIVLSSVTKGDFYRTIWKINPKVQEKFTVSAYSVVFRAEGMTTQRITKVLIMEGSENTMPEVTFLDYAPKAPFYVLDKYRTVSVNGSGFSLFGSAAGQLMEAKLIKGNQDFTIGMNSISCTSDSVISVVLPDGIPLGTYDLYISAAAATGNSSHSKTFKSSVTISDDISYSHNLVKEILLPVVMKGDGKNTPEENITVKGIFIDNGDGTYTSLGATLSNPVIINSTLKFAGGTLRINTNPLNASIWADDGTLWCEITNENSNSYTQAIIAQYGFKFETYSSMEDEDTKVRMVYDLDKPGANYTNDVSYKNIPIKLHSITLNTYGIDINGSMSILNPLTYMTNYNKTSEEVEKLLGELGTGYCQAELGTITMDQDGLNIDGKFSFQMPFVMSLFSGTDAILELNTREEHVAVEIGVSVGNLLPVSAGVKTRIGFRRGRFDEYYVSGSFPQAIEVAPPIPIGISGLSGGIKNTCFQGAFPITFVLGLSISDTIEAMSFQSYNLFSMEGEAEVSPFHYITDSSAYVYMMKIGNVNSKFVWWTLDPTIEKRGLRVEGTIIYYVFEGNVMVSYFEGEGFLGRGTLTVKVPEIIPIIGGLELAGVGTEITEYSIAGSAKALGMDIGIKYYFYTNNVEFLELQEELERANHGIDVEYSDGFVAEYGFNFVPIQFTRSSGENSQYITELNLTRSSNAILVLKMSQEQYQNLNEDSIKIINPAGEIMKLKFINNTDLVDPEGNIRDIDYEGFDLAAVKQRVKLTDTEYEYMVSIPLASPEDGPWAIVTNGSMELLPYSSMKNPEITSLDSTYASDGKITANWILNGEPDTFRLYIINSDQVGKDELNSPANLWGKGNLLYGQEMKYKTEIDQATGGLVQIEDGVIYTEPTKDGEHGTFTTEKLNLPTGTYYIYAKAEKENTVSAYKVCMLEILNPTTPDAPSGLAVEDIGDNRIRISWDADYTMSRYFIYRKQSSGEKYDTGSPYAVYEVNSDGERKDRFEITVSGDELDEMNPSTVTYYFDVRAVGTKKTALAASLSASDLSGVTVGIPSCGHVSVSAPEEISVYTEIRSADDKMFQQSYVEKDNDGIDQLRYKYVTKSKNAVISSSSDTPVLYKVEQNGNKLPVETGFVTTFSKNVTLKEGINYFITTYENQGGDTLTEEFTVELDNKAPSLIITKPQNGDVALNGKVTVSGTTEPNSVVSINNVNCTSDQDGNFSREVDLGTSFVSEITVETRDAAGNVTSENLSVLNDMINIKDITLVPEYKVAANGMTQQLSTYASTDEDMGEKIPDNLVKYSITQGSDIAYVSAGGVLTTKYAGTIIVKAELYVTDSCSLSDSIAVEVSGDKKQSSRYYPPVYSKEELTWLAGSSMSISGGIIKTDDGVILNVPSKALPYYQDNVDIYIYNDIPAILSKMNVPSGAYAASSPYYISLLTDFAVPAQLTLPVNGYDSAYVYYFDEEIGALICKGGTMSLDKWTVTADITRPGTYIALNYATQSIFDDVPSDFWGYDYIYGLNFLNIVDGYDSDGKTVFRPGRNITRSEFIKLLVMACSIDVHKAQGIELKFEDSSSIPQWAVPYIKTAVMKGLVNGKYIDGKNYFAPDDYITREEIAAMIGRSLAKGSDSTRNFSDSTSISPWAAEEIQKLVGLGVIKGYDDNTFRPQNSATRTETAVMIYQLIKVLK